MMRESLRSISILKPRNWGWGSVILFGFIRHLGENAEYIKKMNLPEGVYPLLGVAVGHGPGSAVKRKMTDISRYSVWNN